MQSKGIYVDNSPNKLLTINSLKSAFDAYYPALCFFANKILEDTATAEDVVLNIFIKLWEKEPDFSRHKNIKAALYISVKNACLDQVKRRKKVRAETNALAYLMRQEQEDFILSEISRAEVLREVYAEIQKLPPECRKVMQLHYQQGLDHKSISTKLGVAVSTVRNQKARGLQILKKKLGTSLLYFLVLFG